MTNGSSQHRVLGFPRPISKSAGRQKDAAFEGWETRDTADLEVCATTLPVNYPDQTRG